MKNEISAVVFFLSKLLKNNINLSEEDIEIFSEELSRILYDKYVNHWYPETPAKGQAYRCIRVNRYQGVDPDLQKACFNSGLLYEELGLPKEMTLWVDPCEVCCRYGEKNPSFVVASFDSKDDEKIEISQKVNYAMDKVTSDYHSGSSSEDEVYISHKNPPPTPVIPRTCDIYQVPEFVPQLTLPTWNKNPKRRQNSHFQYQPQFVPSYQQGRNKVYGQVPWMPPMMQNEQNHWTNLHMLSAGRQCLA
ncbi:protein BTG3 [Rana temporaria]|uniref:protein BTG3 n=1 Tax=Rana temporaria TaxID=8407 RepID=UPI001AAD18CE|nr:protein BTG3 [Rana temporaria]